MSWQPLTLAIVRLPAKLRYARRGCAFSDGPRHLRIRPSSLRGREQPTLRTLLDDAVGVREPYLVRVRVRVGVRVRVRDRVRLRVRVRVGVREPHHANDAHLFFPPAAVLATAVTARGGARRRPRLLRIFAAFLLRVFAPCKGVYIPSLAAHRSE